MSPCFVRMWMPLLYVQASFSQLNNCPDVASPRNLLFLIRLRCNHLQLQLNSTLSLLLLARGPARLARGPAHAHTGLWQTWQQNNALEASSGPAAMGSAAMRRGNVAGHARCSDMYSSSHWACSGALRVSGWCTAPVAEAAAQVALWQEMWRLRLHMGAPRLKRSCWLLHCIVVIRHIGYSMLHQAV